MTARSMDLERIVSQPEAYRDDEWERVFFQALMESNVKLESTEAQPGPDGWPYMFARTGSEATEPTLRLLDWLATRGIGLVVNPHKNLPDYVFTYGMIWFFKETGLFLAENAPPPGEQTIEIQPGEQLYVGEPSKQYLPDYVRQILGQFLADQGVGQPRVLMLSRDNKHFDLCWSAESLGSPNPSEYAGVAEALAWFLPQHYSLVVISEKGLPPFYNL